jgi:hypothetical protein
VNPIIRSALRDAGAEAGRQARRDAGLPEYVEDSGCVQRMAEILQRSRRTSMIKSTGGRRYG